MSRSSRLLAPYTFCAPAFCTRGDNNAARDEHTASAAALANTPIHPLGDAWAGRTGREN